MSEENGAIFPSEKDTVLKQLNIMDFVKNNNKVYFMSFRQGTFMYSTWDKNDVAYSFPVPLEDIGTATMLDEDKALTFMRWIRKAIDDKTLIQLT